MAIDFHNEERNEWNKYKQSFSAIFNSEWNSVYSSTSSKLIFAYDYALNRWIDDHCGTMHILFWEIIW